MLRWHWRKNFGWHFGLLDQLSQEERTGLREGVRREKQGKRKLMMGWEKRQKWEVGGVDGTCSWTVTHSSLIYTFKINPCIVFSLYAFSTKKILTEFTLFTWALKKMEMLMEFSCWIAMEWVSHLLFFSERFLFLNDSGLGLYGTIPMNYNLFFPAPSTDRLGEESNTS